MSEFNFTCPGCGDHDLAVERIYEDWAPNGMWAQWFASAHLDGHELPSDDQWQRKIVEERGREKPSETTSEEWSLLCKSCGQDIPFGWTDENRGGWLWPAGSAEFEAGKVWMEPKHADH